MEDLIIAVLSGEASAQEKRTLDTWRNESPDNERLFQDYSRTWKLLPLVDSQEPVSAPPELANIVNAGDRRRHKAIPLKRTSARQTEAWWWATAAVFVGIVAATVPLLRTQPPDLSIATGPTETRTIPLPDGSVVRLGQNSSLDFWRGTERRARFAGVGFFAVVSDSTSPFVVQSDVGITEVLGTRFELRSTSDSLRLVVVDGSVELAAGGEQVDVRRGEMATIELGGTPSEVKAVNVWETLKWRDGLLIFQDTPMADVAAELEMFFGIPISISDSTVGRRVVTAWFEDESFEVVLATICETVGAHCTLGDTVEIAP